MSMINKIINLYISKRFFYIILQAGDIFFIVALRKMYKRLSYVVTYEIRTVDFVIHGLYPYFSLNFRIRLACSSNCAAIPSNFLFIAQSQGV